MSEADMIPDGIYPGVPATEYFTGKRWQGRMSPSTLEHFTDGTMEHVRAAMAGEIKLKTKPLSFGRAYHCRLLEPERFKIEFAVAQQCRAFTRDGKGPQCSMMGTAIIGGEWYCSTHTDLKSEREVISAAEADEIERMRAKVFAHNAIRLIRQHGQAEVCIAWTCPRTGIKCKTRLDKLLPECNMGGGEILPFVIDLKSARSAHENAISKAIEEYGLARAAAMRMDGYETLTGKRPMYSLVFQEKEPPFEVSAVMIGQETMEGATYEHREAMKVWAHCVKTGKYPGYSDDFQEIEAPVWKLKQYQGMAQYAMELS